MPEMKLPYIDGRTHQIVHAATRALSDKNARLQSLADELATALRESLKVHDKYLARSKANAFYPSEFKPKNSPTAGEARIREQARAALAKYDEAKS